MDTILTFFVDFFCLFSCTVMSVWQNKCKLTNHCYINVTKIVSDIIGHFLMIFFYFVLKYS